MFFVRDLIDRCGLVGEKTGEVESLIAEFAAMGIISSFDRGLFVVVGFGGVIGGLHRLKFYWIGFGYDDIGL